MSGSLVEQLESLLNEIDCRIEHGASGSGHLEYVRSKLYEMRRSVT